MHELIHHTDVPASRKAVRERELTKWNETQAHHTARAQGIDLDSAHWEVIHFLRDDYLRHGPHPHAREVAERLNVAFADLGGKKYLRQLFPQGPVTQGMKIAGLPVPPYHQDEGFGISY